GDVVTLVGRLVARIGRTRIGVAAVAGRTAHARTVAAGIRCRAEQAVVTRERVVRVVARVGILVAAVVGADVVVTAGVGRTADADAAGARVASRAEQAVLARGGVVHVAARVGGFVARIGGADVVV